MIEPKNKRFGHILRSVGSMLVLLVEVWDKTLLVCNVRRWLVLTVLGWSVGFLRMELNLTKLKVLLKLFLMDHMEELTFCWTFFFSIISPITGSKQLRSYLTQATSIIIINSLLQIYKIKSIAIVKVLSKLNVFHSIIKFSIHTKSVEINFPLIESVLCFSGCYQLYLCLFTEKCSA